MSNYNNNTIEKRTSRFSFSPTGSYEHTVKRRLNIREFSTYKLYDPKQGGISIVGDICYVQSSYWQDNYTVCYNPITNPYPTPPTEP